MNKLSCYRQGSNIPSQPVGRKQRRIMIERYDVTKSLLVWCDKCGCYTGRNDQTGVKGKCHSTEEHRFLNRNGKLPENSHTKICLNEIKESNKKLHRDRMKCDQAMNHIRSSCLADGKKRIKFDQLSRLDRVQITKPPRQENQRSNVHVPTGDAAPRATSSAANAVRNQAPPIVIAAAASIPTECIACPECTYEQEEHAQTCAMCYNQLSHCKKRKQMDKENVNNH